MDTVVGVVSGVQIDYLPVAKPRHGLGDYFNKLSRRGNTLLYTSSWYLLYLFLFGFLVVNSYVLCLLHLVTQCSGLRLLVILYSTYYLVLYLVILTYLLLFFVFSLKIGLIDSEVTRARGKRMEDSRWI